MIRDDYLIRQIKKLVEAIVRLAKLRQEGRHDEALAMADSLYEELGIPRGLHDVVDTPTLASMLRTADAMRTAAHLLLEEGHIYREGRDPLAAFTRYRRAHELMLEARALEPIPEDDTVLFELSRLAPPWLLDERYRSPEHGEPSA